MNAWEKYAQWMEKLDEADPLRQELAALAGDEAEIHERFYQDIAFGTAGLRGICAAGTNRMNTRTVGRATQGIANYILRVRAEGGVWGMQEGETGTASEGKDKGPGGPAGGVAIAYDCRHYSKEFSELAAEIFAGNGIHAYLFPSMRPTPELSFAIRRLGAVAGVNMTASHNPREYNGYKVYWSDGAQISGAVSDGMTRAIEALDFLDDFKKMPLQEAVDRGLATIISEDMDRAYLDYVKSMRQRPDEALDKEVCVVYTPLNGAGSIPLQTLAAEEGYTHFHIVPEQKDPDPDFTTVGYPNPEDPRGFALAEDLGKKVGAEVLIATDPDADRMAIEIWEEAEDADTGKCVDATDPDADRMAIEIWEEAGKNGGRARREGRYRPLNGNQTGAMLIAYMAQSMQEAGHLPKKAAMIKSIVTGDMGRAICEDYGIRVFEALTGFKNICGAIPRAQALGYAYFFAYEESIGCAPGAAVRDKDGICAAMLVMEMAAWCRKQGLGLGAFLRSLYEKYGYFAEAFDSYVLEGAAGAARIGRIMDAFRLGKPGAFGGFRVTEAIDYIDGVGDIPASNVLVYRVEEPHTDAAALAPNGAPEEEKPGQIDSLGSRLPEKDPDQGKPRKEAVPDGPAVWFALRPSGTEPKIKFYYYAKAKDEETATALVGSLREAVAQMADGVA